MIKTYYCTIISIYYRGDELLIHKQVILIYISIPQ